MNTLEQQLKTLPNLKPPATLHGRIMTAIFREHYWRRLKSHLLLLIVAGLGLAVSAGNIVIYFRQHPLPADWRLTVFLTPLLMLSGIFAVGALGIVIFCYVRCLRFSQLILGKKISVQRW